MKSALLHDSSWPKESLSPQRPRGDLTFLNKYSS